jgi:hypothetical protein
MKLVLAMTLWAQPWLGSSAEQETQSVSFIAPRRDFTTGRSPRSVAVGDFNGDGKPDLAVANQGSNNVSVLLGNGDGTFQAARNFAAGSSPSSVAVGDFIGVGRLDLAVGNAGNGFDLYGGKRASRHPDGTARRRPACGD